MPALEVVDAKSSGQVERIDAALHGLCQPLTVLQCRLAMGEMLGTPEALREAVQQSLRECARLNDVVGGMRAMLQQMMERRKGNGHDEQTECGTGCGA